MTGMASFLAASAQISPVAISSSNTHVTHIPPPCRDTQPQVNKQLNFLLPFMGFGFNYTWLSLHGQLTFSEVPIQFPEYPLTFPVRDWPRVVSVPRMEALP